MKKYFLKSNESKGIFLSLLIHSTLLGAVMFHEKEPMKSADKEKTVSIDLISYQPPKVIEQPKEAVKPKPKPEPIEKPKPKPKPKPIKKPEPKHKPIVPKKPEPKPEPLKEPEPLEKEIKKAVKPTPIEPKEVEKPKNTTPNKQTQQQAFVKTNFAVIRDMVLSNLNYPTIAKRMGWEGVVEVKLVVETTRKLMSYEIVKSSGKKHLDNAAIEAVKAIVQKTLPKPQTKTTLILPISFKLK